MSVVWHARLQHSDVSTGTHGKLCASFERRAGRVDLIHLSSRPPLQTMRPLRPDGPNGVAEMVISTLGPGMLGGDRTTIAIQAGRGSHVRVTTPSANRIHAHRGSQSTVAEVQLRVDASAILEWLPLPTIVQADARFRQSIHVSLDCGSIALVADVWVPGRLARGECFAFEWLDSSLTASDQSGRELVADRLFLRPAIDSPGRSGILPEPHVVFGSLFVLAPDRSLEDLELAIANTLPLLAGVTRLPNAAGIVVRAVGDGADAVIRPLSDAVRLTRHALFRRVADR